MPLWSRVTGTLRSIFHKGRLDRELDDELRSYLDLLTDEKIAAGLEPERARRAARLELGGVEQVKEQVRDRRLGAALDTLLRDVRYGVRTLARSPGFTVVATLILAVGVGATSALYTTIDAALLRPLPYDHPDRLVLGQKTRDGVPNGPVSRLDYFDYRDRSRSFTQLAALADFAMIQTVTGGDRPDLVRTGFVTWNLFRTLGVAPVLGRDFLPREEQGGATAVIISDGLWRRRFGASPDVLGRTLVLDGNARTIVGVMPPGFRFLQDIDVWSLVDRDGPIDPVRDSHSHLVIGRLKPGVSIEQAQADVNAISASLQEEYPATNKHKGLQLADLHATMVADVRTSLWVLMATTVAVLLIACGNVAGLLMARGQRRQPEMAMRAALGASRPRLVRQLLTESAVFTPLVAAAGVAFAYLFQDLLLRLLPVGDLGVNRPEVGAGTLLFTVATAVATCLLVALVPAARVSVSEPGLASGSRVSEGRRSARMTSGLVVVQVGLSMVLLVGSGLLVRSLARMAAVDLGFDPDRVLSAQVKIQAGTYPAPEARAAFFTSLIDEVRALPGVVSASAVSKLPIRQPWTDWPVWPSDRPRPAPGEGLSAMSRWVQPGYFETMRIPILAGRDIAPTDGPNSQRIVVLSARTARTLFPDRSPIGRTVSIAFTGDEPFVVVGIVGDARINQLTIEPDAAFYLSSAQLGATQMQLVVRGSADPLALVAPIREVLRRLDADVVLARPTTMTSVISEALGGYRVVIVALGVFSGLALALAAFGLYGTLAYHVGQRANEIGIRMALGASRRDVLGLIAGRAAALVGGGLLLGLAAAVPVTRLTRQLLFETAPLDAPAYASAVAVLGLAAVAACFVPAWRATRLNPVEVLRKE